MRRLLLVVAVIVVIGCVAGYLLRNGTSSITSLLPSAQECDATVDGHTTSLVPEQAQNAAVITAVAIHRGLPAHAATIAIATAMQESKLYNLSSGDLDSVGLFQQRPSQGWGRPKQLMDPVYAANAFYDALVKIPDYQDITVTEAAQKVQHSAYPDAYAKHEADARALASALTGYSPHAFGCRIDAPTGRSYPEQVRSEITSFFGLHPVVRGDAVSIPTQAKVEGWAVAQYLVAQSPRFGIDRVEYAGYAWTAGKGLSWKHASTAGGQVVLRMSTGSAKKS
jgi:hypothetical protein